MKNEEVKNEKTEQVCGLLAFLKAHPAEVWLRWTRPLRKFSKESRRGNRPERMPVRCLTEMVNGEMVTERIMKATPLNRPSLRTPYPVLTAAQKEAWDVMAEIETGMEAWDDNSSVDGADLDMSRALLDYIASDMHNEAVELGQKESWTMPAAVTTLLAEVDAELKLRSAPKKPMTKKAKVKGKASDAQDKKRKRDGDEDDDDNQPRVKKALKQRTFEERAAPTTTSTPPEDPAVASSATPVASPAGYDSASTSLPGEVQQAEPEPQPLKRMKRDRDDFEELWQFRLQNLMQTKRRRIHLA
jgi:hypothetical protein